MSMVDTTDTGRRIAERVDPTIANQIAISDTAGGVTFRNAGELMEFAKMMSVATAGVREHLRNNPGACLAIVTQALEWGLTPFAVANKSYFVNNQIAFESQLVQAVILKRAPIKGRMKFDFRGEGQERACRAWVRLREDDEIVEYDSPKLKDINPRNSPLWKSDPDQQLAYYSGRALCRRHFPDVLLGIYDVEELVGDKPARGPENARDVTPRGMSEKLDALASVLPNPDRVAEINARIERERADKQDAKARTDGRQRETVDHDPVTGEISGGDAANQVEESEALGPRDQAIDEVRSGLMEGKRLPALLNALQERRGLLSDDDVKALRAAEKALGQKDAAA